MSKKEIGIIGLGKFGLQMGITLTSLGHMVIGLDIQEDKIKKADGQLEAVYQGDATIPETLLQLRFQDLDHVVVSVGRSMEDSILITLNLQEMQARQLIVKASSAQHAKVLDKLGVFQVVQPEREAAIQTANRLHNPGMLDFLPHGGGMLLQQVVVEQWTGKSLSELSLPVENKVMVVASKTAPENDFVFVPDPMRPFEKGEILMLIGKPDDILKLEP